MMRRSMTLPLILLGAGAIACVAAGFSLWRRTFPPAPAAMPTAVVTGSSMVETLYGPTIRGTCDACGGPLRFAIESLPSAGDVLCPHCGAAVELDRLEPAPADRVAIRPLATGESPKVGRLYVFAAPEGGNAAPVVKRIVAAPGQRVSIEGGDLFRDGVRVRKDPRDAERPVVVVHDSRPAIDRPLVSSPWERSLPPGEPSPVAFSPRAIWSIERAPTPVLDAYPSQATERRRLSTVLDVWVAGELSGGRVASEFVYRADSLAWSLRIDSAGSWSLSLAEQVLAKGRLSDWSDREIFRFGMLDRQIFLIRPDRESIVVPIEDGPLAASLSPLEIRPGEGVSLYRLRAERDVHYLPPIGAEEPWLEVDSKAGDGWFALGDYPSYSIDSRQVGRFASESILGEALLPLPAEDAVK